MAVNEENLLTELEKRNTEALKYIIDTYSNLIYRVVTNILENENHECAMECMNDVFLLVWNKYHLYDPKRSSFKNWLLAVSKYKAIDYRRILNRSNDVEIDEEILSSPIDIEKEYMDKETKDELLNLLKGVSEKDREIFIRKYIYYEDIEDITKRYNISRGAVYTKLWRIRNTLMEKLDIPYKKEVIK